MNLFYKIHASDFIVFFVGLYRATSIWWSVKRASYSVKRKNEAIPTRIFTGFGASSEEYIYANYISQSQEKTLRINWFTHDGVAELGCPGLFACLYLVARNAFGYTTELRKAIPEIAANAVDFMTIYALNIGTYAFYRSFWKMAKDSGLHEVAVLALDIPAYACVDEGIKTVYLQHGLMALSIPIPTLHRVDVLTTDEESFLKKTMPHIEVMKVPTIIKNDDGRNNILMIMSLNVSQQQRLVTCEPLISWAIKMGLKIVLRPTPSVNPSALTTLQKKLPQALFDDLTIPLHDSFEKWRPKFVAAWTSTGLATALDHGCLPISLDDPDNDHIWDNIIYPMRKRVLFWPRDKNSIEAAIQLENVYHAQLNNLKSDLAACAPVG